MREVRQFPGDDPHRLGRVGPRHRPDPGGATGRPGVLRSIVISTHTSSLDAPGVIPATSASLRTFWPCDASASGRHAGQVRPGPGSGVLDLEPYGPEGVRMHQAGIVADKAVVDVIGDCEA